MRPKPFCDSIAARWLLAFVLCATNALPISKVLAQQPNFTPAPLPPIISTGATSPHASWQQSPQGSGQQASTEMGTRSNSNGLHNTNAFSSDGAWTSGNSAPNGQTVPAVSQYAAPIQSLPTGNVVSSGSSLPTANSSSAVQPAHYNSANASSAGNVVPASVTASGSSGLNPVEGDSSDSSSKGRPFRPSARSDSGTAPSRSNSTVQMVVSVVSSLLIVMALMLGAAWCYRKANPQAASTIPKLVVSVLGRTPLAPRQNLVLIRFGQKLVLVSNLQGEVRTISEIEDPFEVDRLAGLCESAQAGSVSASFRTVLNNLGRSA